MPALSRTLSLCLATLFASCAGPGVSQRSDLTVDPCLAFGEVELEALVAEAYAELVPTLEEHGIGGARLLTAATIGRALGLACTVQEYQMPTGERVTTTIDGLLEGTLSAALLQHAAADAGRWRCCSVRESWDLCTAAGVAYPSGLTFPAQHDRLRDAVASGAVSADYVLVAELCARESAAGRVEFGVELELVPLGERKASLVAQRHVNVLLPSGARRPKGARRGAISDLEVSLL